MASRGLQTAALTVILASFGSLKKNNIEACDICKHYGCWKSRLISKEWLGCVPTRLHRTVHERWWSFNVFHFLGLPFELREMVVKMVIGPFAEPWRGAFGGFRSPGYADQGSSKSSMSLASVNKQLYSEVMTTFSLYTILKLWHGSQMHKFFRCCSIKTLKSQPSCKNLRSIELDLDAGQLCLLLGIPRDLRVGNSVRFSDVSITAAFQTWVNECRLRRALINLPHVSHRWKEWDGALIVCQKVFCLRVWAGVRVLLRDVPRIEMRGHINETQKQNWMQELALERRGIIPDLEELKRWQQSIWDNWWATSLILRSCPTFSNSTNGFTALRPCVVASRNASENESCRMRWDGASINDGTKALPFTVIKNQQIWTSVICWCDTIAFLEKWDDSTVYQGAIASNFAMR